MRLKSILLVGGLAIALVVGLFAGYSGLKQLLEKPLGLADYEFIDNASDVFGTKTATTTAGQAFRVTATGGQSATSTAVKKVGGNTDVAIYTIMPLAASSTSNLRWEIQGSNDYYCETTATSGGNLPLVSEINWFSVGDHSPNKAQTTSFSNASSTVSYTWDNPMPNVGQEVILENLNYECLRLNMSGSSTEAWVQVSLK